MGIGWIGAIVITIKKENKGNISVLSEQQSLFIYQERFFLFISILGVIVPTNRTKQQNVKDHVTI